MPDEPASIPISALQHWLYCPRQCALIHNEQVWAENRFTAEGQQLHKKANEGPDEHRATGSILRHLLVASRKLKLHGICDIVEKSPTAQYTPVEYKRGKPKSHRADEVQVCAQALCLEEMFSTQIHTALIFYGKTRRRSTVTIDQPLRRLTMETIHAVQGMKQNRITPSAHYDSARCDACSLFDLCQPKALRLKRGAAAWFSANLQSEALHETPSS